VLDDGNNAAGDNDTYSCGIAISSVSDMLLQNMLLADRIRHSAMDAAQI